MVKQLVKLDPSGANGADNFLDFLKKFKAFWKDEWLFFKFFRIIVDKNATKMFFTLLFGWSKSNLIRFTVLFKGNEH